MNREQEAVGVHFAEYLGSHVSFMLASDPFKGWPVERSIENDLPERVVYYVFEQHGMEVHCDVDDIVSDIFLFAEENGGFNETLFEIPFSLGREQVLKHYGSPSKSGGPLSDPILGEYGLWDRFERPGLIIHVEFNVDVDAIAKITLMRSLRVP